MASILNVDQINNAAGTTALTIDSSGQVSLGQKVGWLIVGTDGSGTVSTSPVPWATVNFDYQSGWNNANKRYEIQKTGLYLIGWTMAHDSDPDTWYLQRSTDSGSSYSNIQGHQGRKPSGGFTHTPKQSIAYFLNSGDYLRVVTIGNNWYSWGPTDTRFMQFWGVMIG